MLVFSRVFSRTQRLGRCADPQSSRLGFCFLLRTFLIFFFLVTSVGCSILQTRPIQEMADASAAIRAAKAAGADTKSPEAFRRAIDAFHSAKREYRLKNFAEARTLVERSRLYAEYAEFQAIKQGGTHTDVPPDLNPLAGSEIPGAPSQESSSSPVGGGMNQLPPEVLPPTPLGVAAPADQTPQPQVLNGARPTDPLPPLPPPR